MPILLDHDCVKDAEPASPDQKPLKTPLARKAQRAFAELQALEARLWDEFTARTDSANISIGRVLLIGFDGHDLVVIRHMARAAGVAACATCRNVAQLEDVTKMAGAFSHMIINFDAFETTLVAINAIMAFRERQPDVAVLLVSAAVAADDLGTERKRLCDVTLRVPLSLNRLRDGLSAATLNNKANI